jgi:hypothetical protein
MRLVSERPNLVLCSLVTSRSKRERTKSALSIALAAYIRELPWGIDGHDIVLDLKLSQHSIRSQSKCPQFQLHGHTNLDLATYARKGAGEPLIQLVSVHIASVSHVGSD